MLAEDIGGWLLAGAFLLGSLFTSALALIALAPAFKGMRALTLCLLVPAITMVLVVSCYLANTYFRRDSHNRDEIVENYVEPWFIMGFPPLATTALTGAVLIRKRRKLRAMQQFSSGITVASDE